MKIQSNYKKNECLESTNFKGVYSDRICDRKNYWTFFSQIKDKKSIKLSVKKN